MFKPIRTLVETIVRLAPFLHSDVFTAFWSFPSYLDHYLKNKDQTDKKNGTLKQKTASPGAEPGSSARASNSLTTAPQCHTSFDELILLYHNYFSLP